ncbi:MAG: hypothetical protein HQL76_16850 [Magnetococcales bacterium]|nr:hypothetical protein [Magnetococcales bacterium]
MHTLIVKLIVPLAIIFPLTARGGVITDYECNVVDDDCEILETEVKCKNGEHKREKLISNRQRYFSNVGYCTKLPAVNDLNNKNSSTSESYGTQ